MASVALTSRIRTSARFLAQGVCRCRTSLHWLIAIGANGARLTPCSIGGKGRARLARGAFDVAAGRACRGRFGTCRTRGRGTRLTCAAVGGEGHALLARGADGVAGYGACVEHAPGPRTARCARLACAAAVGGEEAGWAGAACGVAGCGARRWLLAGSAGRCIARLAIGAVGGEGHTLCAGAAHRVAGGRAFAGFSRSRAARIARKAGFPIAGIEARRAGNADRVAGLAAEGRWPLSRIARGARQTRRAVGGIRARFAAAALPVHPGPAFVETLVLGTFFTVSDNAVAASDSVRRTRGGPGNRGYRSIH